MEPISVALIVKGLFATFGAPKLAESITGRESRTLTNAALGYLRKENDGDSHSAERSRADFCEEGA
jgi:hypothetical protein